MEQVTKISVHSLKVHPRNTEFFDDIEGEMYEQFKQSIREDGVLTPIIVSPDMIIISGHQRYLASKDLGIELIPAIIREELVDEDLKLRQLIASNFGRLSNNPSKFRKAVTVYCELNGNIGSGNYKKNPQLDGFKLTQKEIAKELGLSVQELERILSLERKLIPELKQALDKGFISKTAALGICSKLDKSEQQDLLTELTNLIGIKAEQNPEKDKISATNNEIEKLSQEIKILREENEKLAEKETEIMNIQTEKNKLQVKIEALKNEIESRPTIEKEVDKQETLLRLKYLEESEQRLKQEKEEYRMKYSNSLDTLNEQNKKISMFMSNDKSFEFVGKFSEFKDKIDNFISDMKYFESFASAFNEVPEATRKEYIRNTYAIYKWARNILNEVQHDDVFGIDNNIIENVNYMEVE